MKIQEKNSLEIIDVFAIYWDSEGQTFYLGLMPGHPGPLVYSLNDVTILDNSIDFRAFYLTDNVLPGIFHWALIERKLLDEFIDYDPDAVEQFLQIVRSEKIIDW